MTVGDCLEVLRSLEAGSVDLVVTSPPYNIGKPYEPRRSVEQYVAWCAEWLAEVARVVAPDGSAWLNVGYLDHGAAGRCVPIGFLLWPHLRPLHLVQQVVWAQPNGPAARRRLSPRHETLLWLVRDPDVKYPRSTRHGRPRTNPLGKNPTDVWQLRRVGAGRASAERTAHPAQMPLQLATRIVAACSRPGDVVLDPFCGSGTTLLAAAQLGRDSVGVELRADYAEIAIARLDGVARVERAAAA